MSTPDIAADLNDDDGTGRIWALLSEATQPDQIRVGALVLAGSECAVALCEVSALEPTPDREDSIVHLVVLPGLDRPVGAPGR